MPQAAPDLADRIVARFGSIDDSGPMKFLTDAGYRLRRDFLWEAKSGVTSNDDMTAEEWECLLFLVQEWDFGGLAGPEDPPFPTLSLSFEDQVAEPATAGAELPCPQTSIQIDGSEDKATASINAAPAAEMPEDPWE